MSQLELRIELPSYSYSFSVKISRSSSVLDVKNVISTTCPGHPQPQGQKLIYRGRYLNDTERVDEIWKSDDDSHVVHLMVNPSAWTTIPPQTAVPQRPTPTTSSAAGPSGSGSQPSQNTNAHLMPPIQPNDAHSLPNPTTWTTYPTNSHVPPLSALNLPRSGSANPLAYVLLRHHIALLALLSGSIETSVPTDGPGTAGTRQWAIAALQSLGYSWPSVLDEEYPPHTEGGARYDLVTINERPYLQLQDENARPSPFQLHALKTLTHTFAILSLQPSLPVTIRTPQVIDSANMTIPPHVNQVLQEMGLPPIRAHHPEPNPAAPVNVNVVVREFPVRALIMPMALLVFRTVLLLYFVAPARKPVFGLVLLAWVAYEIWSAVMLRIPRLPNVQDDRQLRPDAQQPNGPIGQGGDPQNVGLNRPAAGAGDPAGAFIPQGGLRANPPPPPGNRGVADGEGEQGNPDPAAALLGMMANMNLEEEERAINSSEGELDATPPSVLHKLFTFHALLITTLHPAVWNRRRTALKKREGILRTEARARAAREEADDAVTGGTVENDRTAQARSEQLTRHERRPRWVKDYIDRVLEDEWVDDAD